MSDRLDLSTFFLSLSSTACLHLGMEIPGAPINAKIDFDVAKQNIDLLELMQEKTKGNRTPDEERLLEHLLFETRMRFSEAQKKKK